MMKIWPMSKRPMICSGSPDLRDSRNQRTSMGAAQFLNLKAGFLSDH